LDRDVSQIIEEFKKLLNIHKKLKEKYSTHSVYFSEDGTELIIIEKGNTEFEFTSFDIEKLDAFLHQASELIKTLSEKYEIIDTVLSGYESVESVYIGFEDREDIHISRDTLSYTVSSWDTIKNIREIIRLLNPTLLQSFERDVKLMKTILEQVEKI